MYYKAQSALINIQPAKASSELNKSGAYPERVHYRGVQDLPPHPHPPYLLQVDRQSKVNCAFHLMLKCATNAFPYFCITFANTSSDENHFLTLLFFTWYPEGSYTHSRDKRIGMSKAHSSNWGWTSGLGRQQRRACRGSPVSAPQTAAPTRAVSSQPFWSIFKILQKQAIPNPIFLTTFSMFRPMLGFSLYFPRFK